MNYLRDQLTAFDGVVKRIDETVQFGCFPNDRDENHCENGCRSGIIDEICVFFECVWLGKEFRIENGIAGGQ